MPSRKDAQKKDDDEVLKGLNALREEMRKLRKEKQAPKEEEIDVVLETPVQDKEITKLKADVAELKENIKDIKTFVFENATGAKVFINQQKIRDMMLEQGSADS